MQSHECTFSPIVSPTFKSLTRTTATPTSGVPQGKYRGFNSKWSNPFTAFTVLNSLLPTREAYHSFTIKYHG